MTKQIFFFFCKVILTKSKVKEVINSAERLLKEYYNSNITVLNRKSD